MRGGSGVGGCGLRRLHHHHHQDPARLCGHRSRAILAEAASSSLAPAAALDLVKLYGSQAYEHVRRVGPVLADVVPGGSVGRESLLEGRALSAGRGAGLAPACQWHACMHAYEFVRVLHACAAIV